MGDLRQNRHERNTLVNDETFQDTGHQAIDPTERICFIAASTDIYLWYFVLLIPHSARFGFIGAVLSPVLFSAAYFTLILVKGVGLPLYALMIRALFFPITGVAP
jgi:hypothetical protein